MGLLAFLLTLLFNIPAAFVTNMIQKQEPQIVFQNVSGSLWRGESQNVFYQSKSVGDVSWQLNLWKVLTGKLSAHVKVVHPESKIDGEVILGLSSSLTLNHLDLDITANYLNQWQTFSILQGRLIGHFDRVYIPDLNWSAAPRLEGIVSLEQSGVKTPINIVPGNYRAELEYESGQNIAKLSSRDAPIDVSGTVMLTENWDYKTDLLVSTTPKGNSFAFMIKMAGKATPDGKTHIQYQGNLKPFLPK